MTADTPLPTLDVEAIERRHAIRVAELQAIRAQVYPQCLAPDMTHEDRGELLKAYRASREEIARLRELLLKSHNWTEHQQGCPKWSGKPKCECGTR